MSSDISAIVFKADLLASSGERHRTRFSISSPYEKATGEWACMCEVAGFEKDEAKQECFGVDGLQATILSLFYLRHVFSRFRKQGYTFADVESGDPIDPEMYFDVLAKKA